MRPTASESADPTAHSTPRWVKIVGVIAIVLVVAVGAVLLIGGGNHGPGQHTGQAPAASGAETGGHMPPAGGHTP